MNEQSVNTDLTKEFNFGNTRSKIGDSVCQLPFLCLIYKLTMCVSLVKFFQEKSNLLCL